MAFSFALTGNTVTQAPNTSLLASQLSHIYNDSHMVQHLSSAISMKSGNQETRTPVWRKMLQTSEEEETPNSKSPSKPRRSQQSLTRDSVFSLCSN
jgi:hypothetical protein